MTYASQANNINKHKRKLLSFQLRNTKSRQKINYSQILPCDLSFKSKSFFLFYLLCFFIFKSRLFQVLMQCISFLSDLGSPISFMLSISSIMSPHQLISAIPAASSSATSTEFISSDSSRLRSSFEYSSIMSFKSGSDAYTSSF